ncbi:MAG: single-stranded DNA-binding protein [Bryobacteraceae bacterium]|jgi:single-strand DNA-binding protein
MQKNEMQLAGYLAAKPTLRALPSGTKVANVRMGESYRYTDKQTKTPREHTNWHTLVFYGILAEIAATFDKGDNVYVEGSLQTRQFTPKDASQRTVYEIIVKSCHLVEAPRTKHEPPAANAPGVEYDSAADQPASAMASNQHEWPA